MIVKHRTVASCAELPVVDASSARLAVDAQKVQAGGTLDLAGNFSSRPCGSPLVAAAALSVHVDRLFAVSDELNFFLLLFLFLRLHKLS